MNEELTPEQKSQSVSWVSQRDLILLDIANKRTELEKLVLSNRNLAESNADIENRINQNIGRLDELDKTEKDYEGVVSTELSDLTSQKTQLESSIEGLKKEIGHLSSEKNLLKEMIETLKSVYDKVFNRSTNLEADIGFITGTVSKNATEIENLLIKAGEGLKKMIDVNSENVDKTNAVINELPRMIFDLQRDILERKKFNKTKQN